MPLKYLWLGSPCRRPAGRPPSPRGDASGAPVGQGVVPRVVPRVVRKVVLKDVRRVVPRVLQRKRYQSQGVVEPKVSRRRQLQNASDFHSRKSIRQGPDPFSSSVRSSLTVTHDCIFRHVYFEHSTANLMTPSALLSNTLYASSISSRLCR